MHITNVQTVTMNAILYLQRLSSRTSLLCNRALRSCEFRAEHHVGYITLPLHFFKPGPRTYKNPCWMGFSHIRSMYDRVSLYFPYAKEEMEAAKKNMNPNT